MKAQLNTCQADLLSHQCMFFCPVLGEPSLWGVSLYICFLNAEQCVQADVWVWSGRCWQVRKGSIFNSAMVPLPLVHAAPLSWQPGGRVGASRDHVSSEDRKYELWLVVFVNNSVYQSRLWCKLVKMPLVVDIDLIWDCRLFFMTWGNPVTLDQWCIFRFLLWLSTPLT